MEDDWRDSELEACVRYYAKAVGAFAIEHRMDLSPFIVEALGNGLPSRGFGSVERRMCDISAVLKANEHLWVEGWPPFRNVDAGVASRIEDLLRKYELL
jgi:hypothetical protein